jgi:hypothetical protein
MRVSPTFWVVCGALWVLLGALAVLIQNWLLVLAFGFGVVQAVSGYRTARRQRDGSE